MKGWDLSGIFGEPVFGARWRRRLPSPPPTIVIKVEEDSHDLDRVIVTDRVHNRASMTVGSFFATCTLAPDAVVETTRLW